MFKLNTLAGAVALALVLPNTAMAEFEVSGEAKIEYGLFSSDGTVTGGTEAHDAGDAMKSEISLKLFINKDIGDDSSFHAEVLLADDGEAASDRLEGGEEDSQYEVLREFYFDTNVGDWYLRLGKQQVVWGTADGMKLLDFINPTDYRELNQNTTEDARIPVWMINAEKDLENGSNIQFIISQPKTNFIAGLDEEGDSGAPFIFKGVDSITGASNGFLNIAPALSKVANSFSLAAANNGFDTNFDGLGDSGASGIGLNAFTMLTVSGFTGNNNIAFNADGSMTLVGGANSGAGILYGIAETPTNFLLPASNGNNGETNLVDPTYDAANPDSAFEFMPNATFATFNTFAGSYGTSSASPDDAGFGTEYIKENNESEANLAFRYKASTDSGVNYSLNYSYNYDTNPAVNMSWHDANTGEELTVQRVTQTPALGLDLTSNVAEDDVPNNVVDANLDGYADNTVSVLLHNDAGEYYGAFSPDGVAAVSNNNVVLRFTEEAERVSNIGGSFDMALDSFSVPTILRGELLYTVDVQTPIVDRRLLAIGDLANALKTEKADFFKYVLGIDVTVMTNLLVSTQLIQMFNLDYVEENRTCTSQDGVDFDCSKYTGDPSTLSLTNGLNKGDEVETFVSFFLSKPFGDDGQHRWNNIVIAENGGGYWNRFDVEYGFNDELVGTFEMNNYWGDEDTTFGQFEKSSNVQLGIKYLF